MSKGNGHDLEHQLHRLEERVGEVEGHIPRIGEMEGNEIKLSAKFSSLSNDISQMRASLYTFQNEMGSRAQEGAIRELKFAAELQTQTKKIDELLVLVKSLVKESA